MPIIRSDVLILQTFAFSDTSKIMRLLTRTHGVRSVIAKGALRPRSRFGGLLEPFTEGSASFYLKDGRDLHTLSGFELARSGQPLGRDLIRFGGAFLLAEIVLRTASEEAQPALYSQLSTAFRRLDDADSAHLEGVILAECWALIGSLGFEPSLERCTACGRSLERIEDAAFDHAGGGVRCAACAAGVRSLALPAAAREALLRFGKGEPVQVARTAAHWALLARFLEHHVLDGAPLRSLAFLADALGRS